MFGTFGVPELMVIFLILVLLFGATKLPQIGRGIGEGIRNFKSGLKSDDDRRIEDPERKIG
ncbi:MAG TPA: twin-arginine translocase TatA/TatE family subunit [Thermoanaerobaculia bacterium]|nr:twin-arginine translocase TatA/TatE family subunit [Thermoanaerobaculia bacterium]